MIKFFARRRGQIAQIIWRNDLLFSSSKKSLANLSENQVYEKLKKSYRKSSAINNIVDSLLYPDLGPQAQETLINIRLADKQTEDGK